MPLSAVNMILNGHLIHQDIKQFVDLLTGVMTDQPVHLGNTLRVNGNVGVGTDASATAALRVAAPASNFGTTPAIVSSVAINTTFPATATAVRAVQIQLPTSAASTLGSAIGVIIFGPGAGAGMGAGTTVGDSTGVYIGNMGGAGITNAFGLYIYNQSGALNNLGLFNASSSHLGGSVSIGPAAPRTDTRLTIQGITTGGAGQDGVWVNTGFDPSATQEGRGVHVQQVLAAAAFTMQEYAGVDIENPLKLDGSAITWSYGIRVRSQTAGTSYNAGVYIERPSGGLSFGMDVDGGGSAGLRVQNDGIVIGSTPVGSGVLLSCHGNVYGHDYYTTTNQWIVWPSEDRFKQASRPIPNALEALANPRLVAVEYQRMQPRFVEVAPPEPPTVEPGEPAVGLTFGFRVDDWIGAYPQLCPEGPGGIRGFNSMGVVAISWQALRALYEHMRALEERLAVLEGPTPRTPTRRSR